MFTTSIHAVMIDWLFICNIAMIWSWNVGVVAWWFRWQRVSVFELRKVCGLYVWTGESRFGINFCAHETTCSSFNFAEYFFAEIWMLYNFEIQYQARSQTITRAMYEEYNFNTDTVATIYLKVWHVGTHSQINSKRPIAKLINRNIQILILSCVQLVRFEVLRGLEGDLLKGVVYFATTLDFGYEASSAHTKKCIQPFASRRVEYVSESVRDTSIKWTSGSMSSMPRHSRRRSSW